MLRKNDRRVCAQLQLADGQMRTPYVHKNLWWSLDNGETSFGYGDLDREDFQRIQDWLSHPSHKGEVVFTGWNEHHDGPFQQTQDPMVKITKDGIIFPHREAQEARKANA